MTVEVELKKGWTLYEGESWENLIKDGWVFLCLDEERCAVMTRNGYINRFRNKEE